MTDSKKKVMTTKPLAVLPEIRRLIDAARQHVAATANLSMVWLYWNVGRVITEDSQKNQKRAGYGDQLVEQLSKQLTEEYGRGFSSPNLWDMKRFFAEFTILQTVSGESAGAHQDPETQKLRSAILYPSAREFSGSTILQPVAEEFEQPDRLESPSSAGSRLTIDFSKHHHLGWSHYRILLGIPDPTKRRFYFEQAATQRWSKREIQRQISGALFERVALSRNTRQLVRMEKQKGLPETVRYEDIFKDPYLLDFLGLKGAYSEKDLESAIIANLQQFLSELGSDFCFIRRQYPMRIDDDDYFLDLLFLHRGLRCLVAVDLKIGPFTAADKGQMDLYLSWLKRHEWRKGENEPVGLILCTSKKRQHVELLLSHGPHKMRVSEYLTKLPDKKVLEERLRVYSRLLEE